MKVSKITTVLSEKDIMGLIKDFVKVENLNINKIDIQDSIKLYGVYKKGIDFNFYIDLGVSNVHDNIIYLKIFEFKIAKLKIASFVVNSSLKILDKKLNELGISIKDGIISADLNQIEKNIPNVYFKLNSLKILNRALEIGIDEFVYSADKKVIKKKQEETKKYDSYGLFRKKMLGKMPEKYKKIGEYAFILPDVVDLYYNLLKDKRVSAESKAVLIGIILYLASPVDFIPDFIPFIGEIDDIAIAFFGLNKILNDVDDSIILENYHGKGNILILVKEAINLITSMVGGKRVLKLYQFIAKGIKKEKNS
ncbi:MAG: DUF1232 domain-containing protein [Bacillota bacterium]|nr:DUF1232 domain-containing protein [Bacillota bacterium]